VKVTESPLKDGFSLDCKPVLDATARAEKFPLMVVGAAGMVKLALAEVLESNVPPFEVVQPLKAKPPLGVALTGMDVPAA
jgi:hypothetical protein